MANNLWEEIKEKQEERGDLRRLKKRINKYIHDRKVIKKNMNLNPAEAYRLIDQYNQQLKHLMEKTAHGEKMDFLRDFPADNSDISNITKYFLDNNSDEAKKNRLDNRINMYKRVLRDANSFVEINEREAVTFINDCWKNISFLEGERNNNRLDCVNTFPTEDGRDIAGNYASFLERNGANLNTSRFFSQDMQAIIAHAQDPLNPLEQRYMNREIPSMPRRKAETENSLNVGTDNPQRVSSRNNDRNVMPINNHYMPLNQAGEANQLQNINGRQLENGRPILPRPQRVSSRKNDRNVMPINNHYMPLNQAGEANQPQNRNGRQLENGRPILPRPQRVSSRNNDRNVMPINNHYMPLNQAGEANQPQNRNGRPVEAGNRPIIQNPQRVDGLKQNRNGRSVR